MSSSVADTKPRARDVAVDSAGLTIFLADGRRVSVPLAWYPRLRDATPEQRSHWEILGDGEGIRWPEIDEDLSVAGILLGNRGR
jgi:hypothetical protein